MKTKTIMLCTIALSLGGCYSNSINNSSGPRYMPRAEVSQNNTTKIRTENRMDDKSYDQYEHREPCQNYRDIPRNYVDGCAEKEMKEEIVFATTPSTPPQKFIPPIISTYTVLFDFDKSNIRPGENKTLDQAMNEIAKHHPRQVTITGYTDSSGDATYNQTLSREREQAVSKALLARGVANQTLDREARGEYEQAVQTADGIKNQENRRVVIDFRR